MNKYIFAKGLIRITVYAVNEWHARNKFQEERPEDYMDFQIRTRVKNKAYGFAW